MIVNANACALTFGGNLNLPGVSLGGLVPHFTFQRPFVQNPPSKAAVVSSNANSQAIKSEVGMHPATASPRPWLELARKRMGAALKAKDGWDGPGSKAVDPRLAIYAERLLDLALGSQQARAPFVVPLRDGGLQLEWHTPTTEIEIYIEPDLQVTTWARDRESGYEIEKEGSAARNLFIHWATRLAHKQASAPLRATAENLLCERA